MATLRKIIPEKGVLLIVGARKAFRRRSWRLNVWGRVQIDQRKRRKDEAKKGLFEEEGREV